MESKEISALLNQMGGHSETLASHCKTLMPPIAMTTPRQEHGPIAKRHATRAHASQLITLVVTRTTNPARPGWVGAAKIPRLKQIRTLRLCPKVVAAVM